MIKPDRPSENSSQPRRKGRDFGENYGLAFGTAGTTEALLIA
jgi:hypothetical protein